MARKPLARSRSQQGSEEPVGAGQDEANAAPELVEQEAQVTAEVQTKL